MEKTKKRKKKSLRRKLTSSMFLFALVMVLVMSITIPMRYFGFRIKSFQEDAFEYSRTAAKIVDGDRIQGYLETGEKDAYYEYVRDYLNAVQRETSVKYYYVIVPLEDEMVYIWDADNPDDGKDSAGFPLGYREKYVSQADKDAVVSVMCENPPEVITPDLNDEYGFTASAYSPIFNSAGKAVAVAAVDLSMYGVLSSIGQFILVILMSVVGITLVAVILLYFNIDRRVLKPLNTLKKRAGETIDNLQNEEETEAFDIRTGDEIEDLADAFSKMDGDLREYIHELASVTAEKERISTELNVAKRIQEGMLPRIFPPFPEKDEFELYASMTPAKEVGGDFYDFFMVDDDHIALVMADVSGKGVPGALFMAISKVLIKNSVQAGNSPGEALEQVNMQLLEGNEAEMFVTVWLAVIDIRTGEGIAANAGHEHPALKKADGDFELVKYRHSPAVATIEGIKFRQHEFKLEPGDRVFIYTDGVTEATNENMELMGDERVVEALNRSKDVPPEELLVSIKNDIDSFAGSAPQFDDITMMIFDYKGNK